MAVEFYFSVSKTAVELAILGIMIAGAAYLIKDLTTEDTQTADEPVIG